MLAPTIYKQIKKRLINLAGAKMRRVVQAMDDMDTPVTVSMLHAYMTENGMTKVSNSAISMQLNFMLKQGYLVKTDPPEGAKRPVGGKWVFYTFSPHRHQWDNLISHLPAIRVLASVRANEIVQKIWDRPYLQSVSPADIYFTHDRFKQSREIISQDFARLRKVGIVERSHKEGSKVFFSLKRDNIKAITACIEYFFEHLQ